MIQVNDTLTELYFGHNNLCPEGAKELAKGLEVCLFSFIVRKKPKLIWFPLLMPLLMPKVNKSLTFLELIDDKLDTHAVEALGKALQVISP
jgi:hypothetical protein